MTKGLFKDFIRAIRPYEPGKPIKEVEQELGLRHVLKLASNENALGPSRKALRAMRKALRQAHLYPESKCPYLVRRLADELGVDQNQILCGNGSNELIELLARGFLSEGDQVISSEKSFLVYPLIAKASGAEFISVPMKDYRYDLNAILGAITERTKLIFIANPNNPTGTYVRSDEVEDFLPKVPKDVILCFDEAYVDFVDAQDFPHMLFHIKTEKPNVILLRTFSKSYGLAGLRIGYLVGPPAIVSYLHQIRQPFNVNSLAQAGALAALDDRFFLWRTKYYVKHGRKFFYKQFKRMGLKYLPSQANFVLVDTGYDADEVCQALLRQGLIVRSMKAYGLDTWIRITVGRRSQNVYACRLLERYLKSC